MRTAVDRCPDALFARARRGPLSPVEERSLAAHLGLCELCRSELLLARIYDELPDETDQKTEVRVTRLATRVAYRKTRRRYPARSLAAAFAVAVLVLGGAAMAWVVARRADTAARREMPERSAAPGRFETPAGTSRGPTGPEPAPTEALLARPDEPSLPEALPLEPPAIPAEAPSPSEEPVAATRTGTAAASTARAPGPSSQPAPARPPRLAIPLREPAAPWSPAPSSAGSRPVVPELGVPEHPGAAELFTAANSARLAHRYRDAVERYRDLQARFPSSGEAQLSFFSAADVLVRLKDPAAALADFDRYLAAQPAGPLASEALFRRARCLDALGRRSEAGEAWRRLLREVPGSVYEAAARRRLDELDR